MGFRPDRRGELRVDQILHAPLHQPAEQVGRIRVPQARDKVSNSGIIFMGHRVVISFSDYLPVITESHAMAHPTGGPPTSLPPLSGTRTATVRSEERRGGTECVSTCRSRWSPSH